MLQEAGEIDMDNLDRIIAKAERANSALKSLVKQLESLGVKVVKTADGDMDVDASIDLEDGYSIQVASRRSFMLVQDYPDGCIAFSPLRNSIIEVVADLKKSKERHGKGGK